MKHVSYVFQKLVFYKVSITITFVNFIYNFMFRDSSELKIFTRHNKEQILSKNI